MIAPAGSGKTRVLTERLRHLLGDRGYEREAVLAVAYNVRARDELVERTAAFRPRVQTLNGLGYEVLAEALGGRPAGARRARTPANHRRAAARQTASDGPTPTRSRPYLEALGTVRLALRDPAEVEIERDDVPGLGDLLPRYRVRCAQMGGIDFDEQIYSAIELLLADGELRRRMQARCRHLLVDEFQDLTPAHVLLLRLLAAPRLDVFGVGDDDQVIYGHAGAVPSFLIDFDRLFPGAAHLALEVNYRCPVAVVDAAADLLSWNRRRVPKEITAGPRRRPATHRLVVRATPRPRRWPPSCARRSPTGWPSGTPAGRHRRADPGQRQPARPPDRARRGGGRAVDPARTRGAQPARRAGRAGLRPPRLLAEVDRPRRPGRDLPPAHRAVCRSGSSSGSAPGMSIDGARAPSPSGSTTRRWPARSARSPTTSALVARRVSGATDPRGARSSSEWQVGLGEAMEQLDRSKGEGSSQLDDLEALEQVADLHPTPETFEIVAAQPARPTNATATGVTLATIHQVKGREWPAVVVYGASSGLLPHRLAEDVEEERRVLHVGITRGRDEVVVIADANRPSPFLAELTARAPAPTTEPARLGASAVSTPRPTKVAGSKAKAASDGPPNGDETNPVFIALRTWRGEEARSVAMPPYVIFHDRTMHAIAAAQPASMRELGLIAGVGPAKLEKYGQTVLKIVAAVAAESA